MTTPSDDPRLRRSELLLRMYGELWESINRHILVVWQSISVLVGSFAVLALADQQILSLDFGVTLIVILCAWLIAHLIDAGYWYNRNLAMISNIERLFLTKQDEYDVQYYFVRPRQDNRMITHLKIQWWLGVGIAAVVLVYHIADRLVPSWRSGLATTDWKAALWLLMPYAVGVIAGVLLLRLQNRRNESYRLFLEKSPGVGVYDPDSSQPQDDDTGS